MISAKLLRFQQRALGSVQICLKCFDFINEEGILGVHDLPRKSYHNLFNTQSQSKTSFKLFRHAYSFICLHKLKQNYNDTVFKMVLVK